jgi:hypothetical protein
MNRKKLSRIFLIFVICSVLFPFVLYIAGHIFIHSYADYWGEKLNTMDKKGLLSTDFGAAWRDIAYEDQLHKKVNQITGEKPQRALTPVEGIPLEEYPSISVVEKLNRIPHYTNTITIRDRNDLKIARIQTNHTRAPYDSLPQTLKTALIVTEDRNFYENNYGFEYNSFVRSILVAALETIKNGSLSTPRGTSSLTQQVAKMFVSQLDNQGRRYVARDIDRKIQEIRLAAALRSRYSPQEILEVYANHCITSSYGLIGVADIADGLFRTSVSNLSDAQSIYIARMVKWGIHLPEQIKRQARIDMPGIAEAMGWNQEKKQQVLTEIEQLTFTRPRRIHSEHGHLIDIANKFWMKFLQERGFSEKDIQDFDIINPASLIRKKGNLTIDLTIDLRLQKKLENMVDTRGFGKDTTIFTKARIGSFGETIVRKTPPDDSLNTSFVLTEDSLFTEFSRSASRQMKAGDTIYENIRYKKLEDSLYRRSIFSYAHLPITVDGQYYAYAMMDAETGELLACYSRDKIGSRAASLFSHPLPNGSAVAKPILNALLFDLDIFDPYEKWSDTAAVSDTSLPWYRTFHPRGRGGWFRFHNVARGTSHYDVHNYRYGIGGRDFIFNHLAKSNNILGVESAYRLNAVVFDSTGKLTNSFFKHGQFLYNIDRYDALRRTYAGRVITGPKLYAELCRIVGAETDHINDSLYSVALGTLELTLLEQMHLFNVLYNNTLRQSPEEDITLFIQSIALQDTTYTMHTQTGNPAYHPFLNRHSIRPTLLGLHKRLTSNPADNLTDFDIPVSDTRPRLSDTRTFSEDMLTPDHPLSNFAKSGTTNDIKRPFNTPSWSEERTNYGNWNAVIRIDMNKLDTAEREQDIRDICISAVAEGNREYTGATDGKSLHNYITKDLLHSAGIENPRGFYYKYEALLKDAFYQDSIQRSDTAEAEPAEFHDTIPLPQEAGESHRE